MSTPSSPPPLPLPPPPPTGTPPPPPPPSSPNTSTANYFFGFIITFVVLLLLFVGCGIGSWRRFRLIGTAWDGRLQGMEGAGFVGRKRGRRRLVRPVFWEMWTFPKRSTLFTPASSGKGKWKHVQPISAAFVWSKSTVHIRKSEALTQTPGGRRHDDGPVRGVGATLRSCILLQRPHGGCPPRPPPVERLPPPEAIQVAVMIAMPSPPSLTSGPVTDGPDYVGHSRVGEYQIGVVGIPWS